MSNFTKKLFFMIFVFVFFLGIGCFKDKIFASEPRLLEDGIYEIETAVDENKVLDVYAASNYSGANVQIYERNNTYCQKVYIKYYDDGYTFTFLHSNKLMDVYAGQTADHTNVWQYASNGSDAQKWILINTEGGYYNIKSKVGNKYLTVTNGKNDNFTNIEICSGDGISSSQKFNFNKIEKITGKKELEDGMYEIETKVNSNKVLDVSGANSYSGGNIQIYDRNNTNCQKVNIKYQGDGYYILQFVHSHKLMDVYAGQIADHTNVWQYNANGSDAQKWIIKSTGDGYYNIISKASNTYLTVANGNSNNGTNIEIKTGNGINVAQKFKFNKTQINRRVLDDGMYEIETEVNSNKAIDVSGGSTSVGANVQIYDKNDTNAQKLNIKYNNDGYYTLTFVHSSKLLDVYAGQSTDHTNVWQYDSNGSDAQKWIIESIGDDCYNIISKSSKKYLTVSNGKNENGANIEINSGNGTNLSQKFKFNKTKKHIEHYRSIYGYTSLALAGDSRGSPMYYYKYGTGPNVFFATFCLHGYEDNWKQDGYELIKIADAFYNRLVSMNDYDLADKWTIYIMECVNPDGVAYGYTNNGPGRTTLFSDVRHGIDLNRCWSTGFVPMYSERNYTGASPFLAAESRYLRDFMLQHKSNGLQNVVVDLHGWTQQLIGDSTIRSYYRTQFPENSSTDSYGKGYMINWARANLNAKAALIELPTNNYSSSDVISHNLTNRYIEATLSMLRGVGSTSYSRRALRKNIPSSTENGSIPNDLFETSMEYDGREIKNVRTSYQYKVALAGIIKNDLPSYSELDSICNNFSKKGGIWISPNSREKVLQIINENTENGFKIDEDGYLIEKDMMEQGVKNASYKKLLEYINSDKTIIIDINDFDYTIDDVTGEITQYPFEKLDETQTMDIIQNDSNKIFVFSSNSNNKFTDADIFNDFISNM